jgi:toxin YhaV
VNDENSLRSSGSKSDPYAVFQKMLQRGHPPDDWAALLSATKTDWA